MIAQTLQRAIQRDLEDLLKTRLFSTPVQEAAGEETADDLSPARPIWKKAAPKVFKQQLPKRESETDPDPFPFVLVRLDSGSIKSQIDPEEVKVLLIIGTFDDRPENVGHESVLEIIEAIREHYEGTPNIPGTPFVMQDPFEWVLQDEESFPYFFGAVNTIWHVPAARRKGSDLV